MEAVAIPRDFLVRKGLFRLPKLVLHCLAVLNLSDPLQNDLVVHIKSALDDKDVVLFVRDGDLALMHHVILADDVNVPLVENLERGPLRDDDGVVHVRWISTVPVCPWRSRPSGFGKSARKAMFPVSLLNLPSTVTVSPAVVVERAAVRQHEFDSRIHEFELLRIPGCSYPGGPCIRGSGPRGR